MINTKILKEELSMRLVKIVDMELKKSDKTFPGIAKAMAEQWAK